jgi:hypothetical protein
MTYRKGWGVYLGWLCVLASAAMLSSSVAQSPTPPAAPDAPGRVRSVCDIPGGDNAASLVQATGDSLQRKRWQPQGGVIQFSIKSFASIPDKAFFFVCYRWKTDPENMEEFKVTRPDRLDRNNDGTTWTVTATIPLDLPKVPAGAVVESALPLVPLAEVRIVAVTEDKASATDATNRTPAASATGKTLAAAVSTTIGITHPAAATFLALATVVIVLVALTIIAQLRLKHEGIKGANWLLRIISTPTGYASLSQLQIVLWTLVVAASAVYVMALSGDLIEVTNGTLVLLGIAGAAAVGAKAHNASQDSSAQAAADKARQEADKAKIEAEKKGVAAASSAATPVETAEKNVADKRKSDAEETATAAKAIAISFKNPPQDQTPRWSDLIVNENTTINGVTREIDVTRFQMLLFTLITAAFVLMNVLTTYVIPEIPTGFLTLMGISNGVYLGAKVAQGS